MKSIVDEITTKLRESSIDFRHLRHEPTFTSEDSARVREEPLEIGAKAIVMKVDDRFAVFVLSASRRIDSRAIRKELGVRKVRFATADELMELTGLVPGSVPPFGRPILDLDLFVDPAILQLGRVAFNAGSLPTSIVMSSADYERIAKPVVFEFAVLPS